MPAEIRRGRKRLRIGVGAARPGPLAGTPAPGRRSRRKSGTGSAMPVSRAGTACDLAGPEGAPAVVLIHGPGLTRESTWGQIAPVLARRFRVLSYDLPGHGETARPGDAVRLTVLGEQLIARPTLVMTCEHDSGSPPAMSRAIAREIAGAEVEIVPALQHLGLIERPELFAAPVEEFLGRVLG